MSTIGSETPSTSRDLAIIEERLPQNRQLQLPLPKQKKVLEEDEYLGRMSQIIKRDFFSGSDQIESIPPTPVPSESIRTETSCDTPATDRTNFSTTSSMRSRAEACSMRLNEYLEKYTSEDNAYFDKLQAKQLRRHRHKFPWLYKDRDNHNRKVKDQLALTSAPGRSLTKRDESSPKMIDWHFNPTNSLFYPPSDQEPADQKRSTVNYESSKYMREPIFKEPLPKVQSEDRPRGLNRFTDKIGIDGKLLNGSETPSLGEFSSTPMLPTTTQAISAEPKPKHETNRFYMPCESPRDALAHRLYEDKIARKIRTPKSSTRSDSRTPKSTLDKIF